MTPRSDHTAPSEASPSSDGQARLPSFLGAGNEQPLIDIPFSVYVDGRQYAGQGISLLEAHVVGLADPALENQERLVRIAFDFGGFGVSLHPSVRVLRDSPQRLVLRFTEPTGDHLPQLRHILNDYISGDLTALGTVIRAVPQASAKVPGTRAARGGAVLRRILGTLVVLGLILVLLAMAATLVAQRLLITRVAQPGQVAIAGETLRAVADGQVTYLDPEAPAGEVVFAIASVSGETLSMAMPCDCDAIPVGVVEGSTVLAGEPVLTLIEGTPETVVQASVSAEHLFPIQQAGGAEIHLADGRAVFGRLLDHGPSAVDEALVAIRLSPEEPIAADLAGQAVELRIRRDAGRLLDRLAEGQSFLSSLWSSAPRP